MDCRVARAHLIFVGAVSGAIYLDPSWTYHVPTAPNSRNAIWMPGIELFCLEVIIF